MKNRMYAALAILALGLSACAHSQQPPSPVIYQCSGNYTELNAPASNTVAASIAGASYTWSPPTVGAWCVILQSWGLPAGQTIYQVSVPSNVAQVTTTAGATHVNLTWTQPAPTSTYASYTYILSYAAATPVAVPTAPPLNTPTTSQMVKPALPDAPELAKKLPAPSGLKAMAQR